MLLSTGSEPVCYLDCWLDGICLHLLKIAAEESDSVNMLQREQHEI